jgi:two-component system LytT family response regulator
VFYALLFGAKTFLAAPEAEPAVQHTGLARLQVPVGDKVRLIEAGSIDWVEADDNYVRIHTGGQDYAMRSTLRQVLSDLGGAAFVQIHKSAAVNIAEIETLQPLAKGDAELVLRNGSKLRVSRRFRQDLQARLHP